MAGEESVALFMHQRQMSDESRDHPATERSGTRGVEASLELGSSGKKVCIAIRRILFLVSSSQLGHVNKTQFMVRSKKNKGGVATLQVAQHTPPR